MRSYQEAHALFDSLARRHPENETFQSQLSWCLGNLGATQLAAGQPGSRPSARTCGCSRSVRAWSAGRRATSIYRADRAWSRLDIAMLPPHLNRLPEAVAELERARREFEEIHRERPNNARLTIWLVEFLNPLADALQAQREYSRMLSASEQACHLAEELARTHPEIPLYSAAPGRQSAQPFPRQLVAKLPAHAALDRSASLYEDLVRSYPGVDQYRVELLRVRFQQVVLARAAGDHAAADEAARRAVDRCTPLTQDPAAADRPLALAALSHLHLAWRPSTADAARRPSARSRRPSHRYAGSRQTILASSITSPASWHCSALGPARLPTAPP